MHPLDRIGRRFSARTLAPALAVVGASLVGAACQQKQLFPDMVAPTTAQQDAMGWPAPRYFGVEEGDNQDPMVDTPNYPYGGSDWYAQPGYLQG
ncbi:MAG: hypothetical protein FJ253_03195 [Phycisphaerae bacterium]|nr:hypothetical protein [Phycisphaerae bacterium]